MGMLLCLIQGLGAASLQWGAWGGSGMAAGEGPVLARLARLGLGAIQPSHGLTVLQRVLQSVTAPHLAGAPALKRLFAALHASNASRMT